MNVVSISICVSLIWLCPNSRLMATTGQLARPTWFWPFPMCIIGQLLSLAVASRFMARHRRSTQIFVADWSSSHKASMNTSLASVFPPLSFSLFHIYLLACLSNGFELCPLLPSLSAPVDCFSIFCHVLPRAFSFNFLINCLSRFADLMSCIRRRK